ncbi:MAG: hypothetical protein U1F41_00465 [Burkholderiales bacterium]
MKRLAALLFVIASLLSAPARADPCAGFSDVSTLDLFCPNIEWVKNRAITLGCTVTSYCPDFAVLRSQMAAFLNRLGNALEPTFAHAAQAGTSAQVNSATRVCVTTPVAIQGYPRVASPAGSMLYVASSSAGANFTAMLVLSRDGGTTWSNWSSLQVTAGTHTNIYGAMSPTAAPVILAVGDNVSFAIQPNNFAGTTTDAGCELTVRMDSHTGASSPF